MPPGYIALHKPSFLVAPHHPRRGPSRTLLVGLERAELMAELIDIVRRNWSLEMDGVAMYANLADRQTLKERKLIFQQLSDLELKHANAWAGHIKALGGEVPTSHSGKGHAVRVGDSAKDMQEIIREIEAEERRDVSTYLGQMQEINDESIRATLREVVLDEFAHAHVLQSLYAESGDRSVLDFLKRRQRQGTGSWIGDAVYGVNDGLGSIFGIVSGVSGATLGNSHVVLLAGLAGMVASALSMGSGAYLAAKSEREIYDAEVQHERAALESDPENAKAEMAVFYRLKGVPETDAQKIAEYLAASPDQFLKTMAAEKLNITEDGLSNPVTSALSGMLSTAIGAFIPVIPFFFMTGIPAVIAAAIVSLVAHFIVGALKCLVTVRPWWSSGFEMTFVGAVEGVATYLIGIALGGVGA